MIRSITIGLDECGWGSIAGPLTATACYVPPDALPWMRELGFADSKDLTPTKRNLLYREIRGFPEVHYHSHHLSAQEYDTLGASSSWHKAMRMAAKVLLARLDFMENFDQVTLIVDGDKRISGLPSSWEQICIPKADMTEVAVSTASVMGKVARDAQMIEHGNLFPHYGFEQHKGYPTELHIKALWQVGPVFDPYLHRRRMMGCRALQKFAASTRTQPAWYKESLQWLKDNR